MKKILAYSLLALSAQAFAASIPQPLEFDQRVREVAYNPEDVVTIYTAFGISTHIKFAADETITHAILGDSVAWETTTVANNLFLKPIEANADTNLSVVTNKHVYGFDLKAAPRVNDRVFFQVKFIYPDQDMARKLAAEQIAEQTKRLAETRARLEQLQALQAAKLDNAMRDAEIPVRRSINYWVKGSDEAAPDEAYDDGTFTYFRFGGNREFPAIYLRDKEGNESLVNTTVKGDTIVVQRIAKDYILRKGIDVAQVTNPNYDRIGVANQTGTITPAVQRAVRGEVDPLPQTLPTRNPAHKVVGAIAPPAANVIEPTKTVPDVPPLPLPVETSAAALAPAPAEAEAPQPAPVPLAAVPAAVAAPALPEAPSAAPAAPAVVVVAETPIAAVDVAPVPVQAPPAPPVEPDPIAPAAPATAPVQVAMAAPAPEVLYPHVPAVIVIEPEPHPPLVPRSEPVLGQTVSDPIPLEIKRKGNLRSAPSTAATLLGAVALGDILSAVGRDRSSQWLLINRNGQLAWLSASLATVHGRVIGLPIYQADAIVVGYENHAHEVMP